MPTMKTPGVYIVETNSLQGAVVQVATAVPAFVGYTARAAHGDQPLTGKPWRIESMAAFEAGFGGAPPARFKVVAVSSTSASAAGDEPPVLEPIGQRYRLYFGMRHFFMNGGGACVVVSVGGYGDLIEARSLCDGVAALAAEPEPTLLVVPDAVSLPFEGCITVQQAMLAHCGSPQQRNRFAILDVPDGDQPLATGDGPVQRFRDAIGNRCLDYGAAYYPWLHTAVVQGSDLQGLSFEHEAGAAPVPPTDALRDAAKQQLNLLPPSAAMAGVFTTVDSTRGVWKAPANVAVAGVLKPAVALSAEDQAGLNVSAGGKSINAIRSFIDEGVLVWGARTLDGNSLDWRYVNVRRTVIMLEQSCLLALRALAFEPNAASTWVMVKSMLAQFLQGIWQRGGLAGAKPDDAFAVHCGLGETMTAEDVLEGILRVTVLVAITRPAEFIEITFQQQMLKP